MSHQWRGRPWPALWARSPKSATGNSLRPIQGSPPPERLEFARGRPGASFASGLLWVSSAAEREPCAHCRDERACDQGAWLLRESKLPFRIEPARKPSEPWETFGSPIHLIAQGITIPPKAIAASGPSHPLDQSPGLRAFIQPARPALTPSATGSAMSGLASLLPHRPIPGPLWKERPNSGSETFSC